jgi:hypothetical protein
MWYRSNYLIKKVYLIADRLRAKCMQFTYHFFSWSGIIYYIKMDALRSMPSWWAAGGGGGGGGRKSYEMYNSCAFTTMWQFAWELLGCSTADHSPPCHFLATKKISSTSAWHYVRPILTKLGTCLKILIRWGWGLHTRRWQRNAEHRGAFFHDADATLHTKGRRE